MISRPTIMATNFDSVLRPAVGANPAELSIRMRVLLMPHDPTSNQPATGSPGPMVVALDPRGVQKGLVEDADGSPFECQTWLDWEFNAFAIKFKKMVELSWNNQLILIPPDREGFIGDLSDAAYRDFIGRSDIPAHVVCSLDVQVMTTPGRSARGAHAAIDVVRLANPANGGFRSFAWRITNEDLEFRASGYGLRQVTAAHEIGHWFGSPVPTSDMRRFQKHIETPEDGTHLNNPDDEYGRKQDTRMAMMGAGQLLTEFEGRAWLERVRLHSGCLGAWEIAHRVHFNNSVVPVSARQKRLSGVGAAARAPAMSP